MATKQTTLSKQPYDADELPARAAVVELARVKGIGQWASQICPMCGGGHSKERSLSLDVGQNGVIRFNCFRASCGFAGSSYTNSGLAVKPAETALAASVGRDLRPLQDDVHPLSTSDADWFHTRFGLPEDVVKHGIYRTQRRYALPIFRPNGTHRGYITRRPWDGSMADTADNRLDSQWPMKALTYLEADEPVQSWYFSYNTDEIRNPEMVILVEDPISAMRLTSFWKDLEGDGCPVAAVAILGTGLNAGKIQEIQRVANHARVYIALDADATGQAFAMARKWGGWLSLSECDSLVEGHQRLHRRGNSGVATVTAQYEEPK